MAFPPFNGSDLPPLNGPCQLHMSGFACDCHIFSYSPRFESSERADDAAGKSLPEGNVTSSGKETRSEEAPYANRPYG